MNLVKNILQIKKEKSDSNYLSSDLFAICEFCNCKFSWSVLNIDLHKIHDNFYCSFCLKNDFHLGIKKIFLFSFARIINFVVCNKKKEVRSILKNLYVAGNNYPFLNYNSEANFWTIYVNHDSLIKNQNSFIFSAITEMYQAFEVLSNSMSIYLRCHKKNLFEELNVFLNSDNVKNNIFYGNDLV